MTAVFDHRDTGTPEAEWAACARLAGCPAVMLPSAARLVVLAAHPDDETLGAGGIIATAARSGSGVEVVIATDGEMSHPDSPTHTPAQLAATRRIEATAAVAALAPTAVVSFLGLPDGALMSHRDVLGDALRTRLDGDALLVSPWRDDRHPDHEACALAASDVAAELGCGHWQYPIWMWHWGDPASADLPWPELRRVDLDESAAAAKLAALSQHVSQHAPLSAQPGDEAILPPRVTAHFARRFETFVVPAAPASDSSYFDALYSQSDDPWGLQDRFYEQRKRDLLCAVLPKPHFRRAFEPGCATGLLTARLAQRCDEVLACDVAQRAVTLAGRRLGGLPHVRVERRRIPDEWPDREFDLIVLSEVAYYVPDLPALAALIRAALAPDGVVVACHWRHAAPDHPHTADDVHRALGNGLFRIARHVEDDFLLDVWARAGDSVARSCGIVG